jgi:uracil-DNA glycosylase
MLTFPFGQPIEPVRQEGSGHMAVFVLGVYASAVHARWRDEDGTVIVNALAVASEPEISWRGDDAEAILSRIVLPKGAGRLEPAGRTLNGPSGIALDKAFLEPLGMERERAWLCDLLPESRCNPKQAAALEREYAPRMSRLGLPAYDFPPVPARLASDARVQEIEQEVAQASPSLLVTLGDQPLKWFASRYGAHMTLGGYGETDHEYGRLHDIVVGGRSMKLLPLVHPRQAARLGTHSPKWSQLHASWAKNRAGSLLDDLPA